MNSCHQGRKGATKTRKEELKMEEKGRTRGSRKIHKHKLICMVFIQCIYRSRYICSYATLRVCMPNLNQFANFWRFCPKGDEPRRTQVIDANFYRRRRKGGRETGHVSLSKGLDRCVGQMCWTDVLDRCRSKDVGPDYI